ncbi:unnamed protein product [Paramecium primaurelia]|uniref:Uncharacterized protein n=2 Tax=Paramecium TaxID=5884 RepID=A0A8S1YDI4_9CILI|nr:unnamed protein product [Paramecium primaurelia]CAD8209514.1 unnamed protein product [Paramecium pentaurelia]
MGICESHTQDYLEKFQDSKQSVTCQCYTQTQQNRIKVPILNSPTQNSLYSKRQIQGPNKICENMQQAIEL